MKSAEAILREALIGKTLVRRDYHDEPLETPSPIKSLQVHIDESREDAKLYLTFESGDEVDVYMNEGLHLTDHVFTDDEIGDLQDAVCGCRIDPKDGDDN